MVTQVKDAPARRKSRTKTKNDAPPVDETGAGETAGGQDSTDSETDADRLSARLKSFGFDCPVAMIGQWDGATFTQIELTASRWQDEFDRANVGQPITAADRTPVPSMLTGMESVTPELQKFAQDNALVAVMAGQTADANLYPPGSALGEIWLVAFNAEQSSQDKATPADVSTPAKGSPPDLTKPANAAELNAKREADRVADFELRQQTAIEDAQAKIEAALEQQQIAKSEWNRLKKRLKSVKQDYDDAVEEAQEGYDLLRDARDGNLPAQRQLPFKDEKSKPSVPDVNVKASGEIVPAPVEDAGASVPLAYLIKKEFAEYFDVDLEDALGISNKQMEEVKKVVGKTVGSLEKWIKENGDGEWGWKNLADRVDKVAGKTIEKLEAAYHFVRRKYPMPDPNEVVEAEASPATTDSALSAEEALERLDALTESCESIAQTCESDDGVEFLTSVGEQASAMWDTIDESGKVTPDQSRAIVNWEAGVAKWNHGEPIASTEDEDELEVDDLEEDLD